MSFDNRLRSLQDRHHQIEDEIHQEVLKPAMDADRVRELKREKLKIKDEMESMRRRVA